MSTLNMSIISFPHIMLGIQMEGSMSGLCIEKECAVLHRLAMASEPDFVQGANCTQRGPVTLMYCNAEPVCMAQQRVHSPSAL